MGSFNGNSRGNDTSELGAMPQQDRLRHERPTTAFSILLHKVGSKTSLRLICRFRATDALLKHLEKA